MVDIHEAALKYLYYTEKWHRKEFKGRSKDGHAIPLTYGMYKEDERMSQHNFDVITTLSVDDKGKFSKKIMDELDKEINSIEEPPFEILDKMFGTKEFVFSNRFKI